MPTILPRFDVFSRAFCSPSLRALPFKILGTDVVLSHDGLHRLLFLISLFVFFLNAFRLRRFPCLISRSFFSLKVFRIFRHFGPSMSSIVVSWHLFFPRLQLFLPLFYQYSFEPYFRQNILDQGIVRAQAVLFPCLKIQFVRFWRGEPLFVT